MTKTTVADTIVIVDDELQNVLWMADYLDSEGLYVQFASNVNEAIDIVESGEIYRAVIVDLNIPVLEPFEEAVERLGPVYVKYPGLFVAKQARTHGYRDRQVVIYTVHRDPDVSKEAGLLGCTYIIKGRPREIMSELALVLSFDPTAKST